MYHNAMTGAQHTPGRPTARRRGHERPARSPDELLGILRRRVEASFDPEAATGVVLEGVLEEVPEQKERYNRIYGAWLADENDASSALELVLPRRLADSAHSLQGARVRLSGDVTTNVYRGRLSFRVEVRQIEAAAAGQHGPEGEGTPEDAPLEMRLARLMRGYRRYSRSFPAPPGSAPVIVGVVHPVSGSVIEDFLAHLRPATVGEDPAVEVHPVPANVHDPAELAAVLRDVPGDVVVALRGGGLPTDLEPFNDPRAVEAWMHKEAYTMCAVGHASDGVLLGAVSDVCCETPTAAGRWLCDAARESRARELSPREVPARTSIREQDFRDLTRQRDSYRYVAAALVLALGALVLGAVFLFLLT